MSTPHDETNLQDALARAATLAGINGGAIHRRQLRDLGISAKSIRGLVKRGAAHDLDGGVIAWGHPFLPSKGWQHAALLSAGPDSALSWWTAAWLHGMINQEPSKVHVSVPVEQEPAPCRNAAIHRSRDLVPADVQTQNGVRLTRPTRTLLDLAPFVDAVELRRMVEVVATRHRVSVAHIAGAARRRRPAPGTARLYGVAMAMTNPAELRSDLERRFRSRWERAGHPPYLANHVIAGKEGDVVFVDRRLLFELDVYEWHGGESNYRNDRLRARIFGRAGYDVFHIAGEDFDEDPDAVIDDVAAIVDLHPPRPQLVRV